MEDRWRDQSILDELHLSFLLNRNELTVATSNNARSVESVRSNIAGFIVRQDAAILSVFPGIHVNVPKDDPDEQRFADSVLEPWLRGMWDRSQEAGKVWARWPRDLRGLGRAWGFVSPIPKVLVDEDYKQWVADLQDETDPEARKALQKNIKMFKQDRCPIRWRYVDPRTCWSTFDGPNRLPQVIELRKMTYDEINEEYPDADLSEFREGQRDIEVYEWANWNWCATVLKTKAGQILNKYEHKLGMNPYVLVEADLLWTSDRNERWESALFGATSTIKQFDTVLSDMAQNHHEWTRAPIVVKHDVEAEMPDEKTAGRPEKLDYGPGKQVDIWNTEDIELGPVQEVNQQSITFASMLRDLAQQTMFSPVEQGMFKSGTSNNLGTTSTQLAEREFQPSVQGLEAAAQDVCKLFMRSVKSINKEYPDYPDEVYVYGKMGQGVIGVTPKQLEGWEPAVQCRISRAIPQDGNMQLIVAQGKVGLGVSKKQVLEEDLGYENPQRVLDQGWDERLDEGLEAQDQQAVLALSGQMWAQPSQDQLDELQKLFPNASASIQQAVGQLMQTGQGQNNGQSQANVGRTGVPQMPQSPQEQVLPG